ncbi:MAG: hypothetical protein L6Q83_10155 [Gammaproteobacteria bacterium]|nr:hypothetical protein [Gammaproteobacteria bacterium]
MTCAAAWRHSQARAGDALGALLSRRQAAEPPGSAGHDRSRIVTSRWLRARGRKYIDMSSHCFGVMV